MLEKASKFHLVFLLLRNGALSRPFLLSTVAAADELGISQQSASRWLSELEKEGLVERTGRGVRITSYGAERCRTIYSQLKSAFEAEKGISLEGSVVRGVGDGRYYLSMPEYARQVRRKLGWKPYPGTLNLAVSDQDRKGALIAARGIELEGFLKKGRTLGAAKCFRCRINGKEKGAVIIPLRSHYGSGTVEIISPANLRKKLGLRDGARVAVDVELPE